MPEQIATKPYASRRQWRWAFATGQPFAHRWAHETPGGAGARYRGLPRTVRKKVARKSYTLDDLERVALKEANPIRAAAIAAQLDQAALKGQQLAPGVTRIHGDLCNVHGRWGSCSAAGYGRGESSVKPYKPLPKGAAGRGGKRAAGGRKGTAARGRAPAKTEAQRQQERAARHAQSQADQLAREARAEERYQQHHAQSRAEREAERLARAAAKPKRGGGGGRGKKLDQPKATIPRTPTPRPSAAPKPPSSGGGGRASRSSQAPNQIAPELLAAAQALSDGKPLNASDIDALIRNGLAFQRKDGALVLSVRGQRALQQPQTKAVGSAGDYLMVEDRTKPSTWHLQMDVPSEKTFAVFKDSAGNWRWLSRTTTAFEDRDREVISIKALEADVMRADADGKYGPLRWWHLGRPNPLDAEQPWGVGVDLGWCDFNAVSGKTLIESGTFKSEAIARAVAAKADHLELSPGFFHAAGEPDTSGVFHHIRRFERSLVPIWAGRASNPYTGLVVEKAMDPKKIAALKALGLDETTLKSVLAEAEQTEKAAEAEGVRYKDHPIKDFFVALLRGEQVATKEETPAAEAALVAEEPPIDPLIALKAQIEALTAEVAALKAPPPPPGGMDMEDDPAQGGDTGADEAAEGEPPLGESGDGGLTLSTDDLAAIGQVIGSVLQSALEPLIGAMGITQKLEGHLGELKTMMGGYVKQKDDEAAQAEQARQQEIATLKARLDELTGDQPRGGYRPSQTPDNTPWADPQILAAVKGGPSTGNGFEDLTANLFPGLAPGS